MQQPCESAKRGGILFPSAVPSAPQRQTAPLQQSSLKNAAAVAEGHTPQRWRSAAQSVRGIWEQGIWEQQQKQRVTEKASASAGGICWKTRCSEEAGRLPATVTAGFVFWRWKISLSARCLCPRCCGASSGALPTCLSSSVALRTFSVEELKESRSALAAASEAVVSLLVLVFKSEPPLRKAVRVSSPVLREEPSLSTGPSEGDGAETAEAPSSPALSSPAGCCFWGSGV